MKVLPNPLPVIPIFIEASADDRQKILKDTNDAVISGFEDIKKRMIDNTENINNLNNNPMNPTNTPKTTSDFFDICNKMEKSWIDTWEKKVEYTSSRDLWKRIYRGLAMKRAERKPYIQDNWFTDTQISEKGWDVVRKLTLPEDLTVIVGLYASLLLGTLQSLEMTSLYPDIEKTSSYPVINEKADTQKITTEKKETSSKTQLAEEKESTKKEKEKADDSDNKEKKSTIEEVILEDSEGEIKDDPRKKIKKSKIKEATSDGAKSTEKEEDSEKGYTKEKKDEKEKMSKEETKEDPTIDENVKSTEDNDKKSFMNTTEKDSSTKSFIFNPEDHIIASSLNLFMLGVKDLIQILLRKQSTLEAMECLVDCVYQLCQCAEKPRSQWTMEATEMSAILKKFADQEEQEKDVDCLIVCLNRLAVPNNVLISFYDMWIRLKENNDDTASLEKITVQMGDILMDLPYERRKALKEIIQHTRRLIDPYPGGFSPETVQYAKYLGRLIFWAPVSQQPTLNEDHIRNAKVAFNDLLTRYKTINIPYIESCSDDYDFLLQNIIIDIQNIFPQIIKLRGPDINIEKTLLESKWSSTRTESMSSFVNEEESDECYKSIYEFKNFELICTQLDYIFNTKTGLPLYSDLGSASGIISGIHITLVCIAPAKGLPYHVQKCVCIINKLVIHFEKTQHRQDTHLTYFIVCLYLHYYYYCSLLNKLSIKKFAKTIKNSLAKHLQQSVTAMFNEFLNE
ncbi:hypothetical protein BDF14DRAFT_1755414 [Spinellus fusiger]|nr:hypothetical protein BDF14DRAFT_1755414 [Spinellus fusiger]